MEKRIKGIARLTPIEWETKYKTLFTEDGEELSGEGLTGEKLLELAKESSARTISLLTETDIPIIVTSFAQHNLVKPSATFEGYLKEQQEGMRLIWVAYVNNQFAGYVTLTWQSKYQPFRDNQVPEIMDLNVLPPFRNCGVGSQLLETAEIAATEKSNTVGIGVGLYQDYGIAQKLYVKRGYIPDGKGVTYNYQPIAPGNSVSLDDELVMWFTKKL